MNSGDGLERFPPDPRPAQGKERATARGDHVESLTDEQLVTLTQQGNVSAFNSLAGRWHPTLHGFVTRTLGNPDEAQDVCQETLLKAYRNIRRLRDGGKFKAWIHHIALNLCRDRFRAAKARGETIVLEEATLVERRGPVGPVVSPTTDEQAERVDLQGVLGVLLAELPAEQRTSILLREYQGFTSEEIGEIMGVPAATVRTRIYYGLRSLRKALRNRGLKPADFS
jgi:RNA polymerase sigma-70 factor (ECF subfamily)